MRVAFRARTGVCACVRSACPCVRMWMRLCVPMRVRLCGVHALVDAVGTAALCASPAHSAQSQQSAGGCTHAQCIRHCCSAAE